MRSLVVRTSGPEETRAVGLALGRSLSGRVTLSLEGPLGSGKSVLARGVCEAVGVAGPVTSPTFTVGHRYRGSVDVSHLDLYRFRGLSAAEWGDLEPYFEGAVVFVEWPEAGSGALPRPRAAVRLAHLAPERRLVTIEAEPGTPVADFTAE